MEPIDDRKKVRSFGLGLFPLGAAFLALSRLRGHPSRGWALAAAAWFLGALTLAWPAAGRRVYAAWMAAARALGSAVSNALLALVFYGIVTPVALARRALGKDPLRLRPRPGTQWSDLEPVQDKSRYERLY